MGAAFRVGRHPSVHGRLLADDGLEVEGLDAYRERGGYAAGTGGAALLDSLGSAGLRGRGGASFPTATKLAAVAAGAAPRCAVANGAEGEPASVKDRYLVHHRPHLVLDGLLRAA
jgi:NADH:ubiquinone oxidoreductase subunit F (NADH-binding)